MPHRALLVILNQKTIPVGRVINYDTAMLVLLYHGVRPTRDILSPDIRHKHVPEYVFEWHMRILRRIFHVISLREAVAAIKAKSPLPWNTCVITFDDGYANNAEIAAPILKKYSLPATFFLTTEFVDQKMQLWVDRFENAFFKLHDHQPLADAKERDRLKKLPADQRERLLQELEQKAGTQQTKADLHRAMTWDQARALHADGFEIGAHTKTHPILSLCTKTDMQDELSTSKARIEKELQSPCIHFAYPNGQPSDWNNDVLAEVRTHFTSCCTTESRFASISDSEYAIPRLTIDMGDNIFKFLLTITGIRSMLQAIKRRI